MLPCPDVILLPESRPITMLSLPVALLKVELPIATLPDPDPTEASVASPIAIFSLPEVNPLPLLSPKMMF